MNAKQRADAEGGDMPGASDHRSEPEPEIVAETDPTLRRRSPAIAIVAERRHLGDRALRDARTALENAGCDVQLVVPDPDQLFDIPAEAPSWDAVVSRGRDQAVLSI